MSKPIDFPTREWRDSCDDLFLIKAGHSWITLITDTRETEFKDPAKLREISKAFADAAQAIEDSNRLTFADLKPGEWFKWTGERDGDKYLRRKCKADCMLTFYSDVYTERETVADTSSSVIRVKATFTEVDE